MQAHPGGRMGENKKQALFYKTEYKEQQNQKTKESPGHNHSSN